MIIKELKQAYYCMWCGSTFDTSPENVECPVCHRTCWRALGRYVLRNQHWVQIIKISSADVIGKMRNGSLWFQSPQSFQKYSGEGQKARADAYDSRFSYINKSRYVEDQNSDTYRLLCFYSLIVNEDGDFLERPDKRLGEFGDRYSIVDITTLLTLIKEHIVEPNKKISSVANWINYLRENYSGVYSPFCKFPKFRYQNEFRIVLWSNLFFSLRAEPYKPRLPAKGLYDVFSEPRPLDELMHARSLEDL